MLCTFMMLCTRCCCHPSIWFFQSRTSFSDTKKCVFTRDIFLGPFEIIFCAVYDCDSWWPPQHVFFETPPTPPYGPFPWPASKYNQSAVMWNMLSCFNSWLWWRHFYGDSLVNLQDNEYVGCLGDLFSEWIWSVEEWHRRSLHCVLCHPQGRRMTGTLELPRCLHPERSSCNALQLDVVWRRFFCCWNKRTGFLHHGLKKNSEKSLCFVFWDNLFLKSAADTPWVTKEIYLKPFSIWIRFHSDRVTESVMLCSSVSTSFASYFSTKWSWSTSLNRGSALPNAFNFRAKFVCL